MPLFGFSPEKIATTCKTFMLVADTVDDKLQMLKEQKKVLLSQQAIDWFYAYMKDVQSLPSINCTYATSALEQYVNLLEDSRVSGVEAAGQRFKERQKKEPSISEATKSVDNFAECSRDEQQRMMEESSSILLSNTTELILIIQYIVRKIDSARRPALQSISDFREGIKIELSALMVKRRLYLIDGARVQGISELWSKCHEITRAINVFISAVSWEDTFRILEEEKKLLFTGIGTIDLEVEIYLSFLLQIERCSILIEDDNRVSRLRNHLLKSARVTYTTYFLICEEARRHGTLSAKQLLRNEIAKATTSILTMHESEDKLANIMSK